MRWAMLCCLVLVGIHVYLGFHIVRRGVLFVDLAMAQAAALGGAVGIILGLKHGSIGEFALSGTFALGSAWFFASANSQRIHKEALIATFYALAVAATFVVLERSPHGMEEVKHLLVGQLLTVSPRHILVTIPIYALVGLAHAFLHRRTTAITEGQPAQRRLEFFFYASFALVVTSSVGLVGVLLVFSYLVIPAVAGLLIAQKGVVGLLWGWGLAIVASFLGLQVAYISDMPATPVIVLSLGALLLGTGLVGSLRSRLHLKR
jgi:zinc/manganese transport system permease protein